jgi:phospholipase C
VISPWAKADYVDHTQISLASVVRFIEDNWLHGARIGGGSFDAAAGSLEGMFDFTGTGNNPTVLLNPQTGELSAAQPAGSSR